MELEDLATEAQQMQADIMKMAEDFVRIQVDLWILESMRGERVNMGIND